MVSSLFKGYANFERDYVNMSVKDKIFDMDADDLDDDEYFEFCMVGRFTDGASI